MKPSRRQFGALLAAATCLLGLPAAQVQSFPAKPITLVVPFSAGSGTDQMARLYAQLLGDETKVPVVVDNRAGASDLIAAAKASPGKLNFGSGSSSSRVASELLKQMTGVDMINVPYKSNPMAITDLIGGRVDFMFADTPTALLQVTGGKLRALAVSGTHRLAAVPSLPTVDEAGVKGYDMSYWTGIYLPAGTPKPVVQQFNAWLAKASASPAAKEFLAKTSGVEALSTPEQLAQFQAAESGKWGRIVQAAGIQPD